MIDKLVIVEYAEGAGGEFISSFISAHWGQNLSANPQKKPNHLQKWFNTYSLILADWDKNFKQHAKTFLGMCMEQDISRIAVPYHLYKWPHHQEVLQTLSLDTRFVGIDSTGHEQRLFVDFQRKIANRILDCDDFGEIQLWLKDQPLAHQRWCMDLFRQKKLTLKDISPRFQILTNRSLPIVSNDFIISYGDFFVDFTKTSAAYERLCQQLDLVPDQELLVFLIDRNRKNLEQQNSLLT